MSEEQVWGAADNEHATKGMDAIAAAIKVAMQAAEASPTREAKGTTPCSACGGTMYYHVAAPKRRRVFLRLACETANCVRLIT